LCSQCLDALRQLQLLDVDRVADGEMAHVHLDERRQVVRQAGDVELVEHVVGDAALLLHAGRQLGVDEVQRHLHVDLLVLGDALKVDVLHVPLPGVHVERAQQHVLGLAVELQRQDRGMEPLIGEVLVELLVVELDLHCCPLPP
jgi:hypothetical protein